MFHYVNAITNTKGDALIGYYVRLIDSAGNEVSLYADENSTPISVNSGVENAAKVDHNGNADFHVADGEYTIVIYATDGTTEVDRYSGIPMSGVAVRQVATVAELAGVDTDAPAILTASGEQGVFYFDSSDLSVEVAADPEQNKYVAPSSDDTGASGAWVRIAGDIVVAEDTPQTGVVSGLGIAYIGDLDFVMASGSYYLGGILHNAVEQEVTLEVADPTDPRIDVLYLDTDGVLQVMAGEPASSPSKPSLDPLTQLELTFVLVPAGATDLENEVTTENIYLENTEWTTSQQGSALTLASTNNPDTGTVCVEMTGSVGSGITASVLTLRRSSAMTFGDDGKLVLRLRAKSSWGSQRRLLLFFVEGETMRGMGVTVSDGAYGFSSSNTTSYQTVIIDKSAFAVTPTSQIDGLKIVIQGATNSTRGFYLDNIWLQNGGAAIGSGLDQAAADARYLRLTGGTLSGDLIVPAETYGAGWNGDNSVPTKNDVYDKIETVIAGAGTGDMLGSNNLSDVANAATARSNLSAASTSQTAEQISGFIASPSDKSYKIAVKMAHAGTITEATTISASGTCTATFKINSTALGGTANSVSSAEQSQSHASSNAFSAGDDIVLTVSSNSSCADMSFTLKYTRTLA